MSEISRKANLEFGVQNNTKSGLEEIKRDIQVIGREAEKTGDQARSAFDGMGKSSEEAAAKFTRSEARMASGLRSTVEQMEVALRQSKGLADAFQFKAEFRGFDAAKFDPMLARVRELESQLSLVKAAEAEWAAQNAFAQKSQQAAQMTKAGEYASWWAAELKKADAAEDELAAQNAFSKKHQQATELAKASQYASWWSAELNKVEAAERKLASETAFIKSLKSQSDAIGKTRADLLELQAAQMGISAQAAPYIANLRQAEKGMQGVGMSAKAMDAAMRGVPAQISDIVVSLQGGIPVMTVFMQQGFQLRDMFGGFGPAGKALATTLVGLVNPYTVAAAAVAALGFAMGNAEAKLREQMSLLNQLSATGRDGYLNAEALKQLKHDMAELPGVSKGMATAIIGDLASVRTLGGEALEKIALLSADFAAATGQDAAGAAKELAKAMEDPAKSARSLDEAFGFLTASQLLAIEAMSDGGDKAGAQTLLLEALSQALQGTAGNQTELQKATTDLSNAWDDLMGTLSPSEATMLGISSALAGIVRGIDGVASAIPNMNAEITRLMPALQLVMGPLGMFARIKGMQSAASDTPQAVAGSGRGGVNPPLASSTAGSADAEIKALLEATKGYEAKGAAVAKVQGDIERLGVALKKLRDEGKGDSAEAKKLESNLAGAQEKLKSLNKADTSAIKAYNKELTDQQKLIGDLSGLSSTFYKDWESLNKQYTQGRISLQALETAQAKLLSKQPFAIALAKEEAEAAKARVKAYEDEVKAQEKLLKQRQDAAQKAQEAVQKAREEEEAYALAEAQGITLAEAVAQIAYARAEENYQKALSKGLDAETLLALQQERDARRELIEIMAQKGVREANTKAQKEIAKDWEKLSQTIGRTLSDYIMGGGKDAATYLKRLFATLVLEPVVNYGVQSLLGAVGMGGGSTGGSNALGVLNNASSLNNAYGLFGGGGSFAYSPLGTKLGLSSMGAGGMGPPALSQAGSAFSGAMSYAGYAAAIAYGMKLSANAYDEGYRGNTKHLLSSGVPVGISIATDVTKAIGGIFGMSEKTANIITAGSLWAKGLDKLGFKAKTSHTGAGAIYENGKLTEGAGIYNGAGVGIGQAKEYNASAQASVSGVAQSIGSTLESVAAEFGKDLSFRVSTAFADDSSKDGAWGALKISDALGNVLVNWENTRTSKWAPKVFSDGEAGYQEYLNAVQTDVLTAIQAMNLPGWAKDMFAAAEGAEGLQTAMQGVGVVLSQFESIGKSVPMFAELSGDMQTAMLNSAGGMDALTGYVSSFNQGFFSEAERMQLLTGQVRDALAGLDISIDPAMGDKAKAEFKAAVQAATDAGNGELVVQLLSINQAFAATADYAQGLGGALDDLGVSVSDVMRGLLEDRRSLEAELLRAQGDDGGYKAALRAIAVEGFDAAEIAAWDFNTALQAQIDALDAATAAAQEAAAAEAQRVAAVAQQRLGLEGQLLQLQGNTAELRARELAALDESNRSLQEWIWALQDSAAASQAAAQAAEQAAQKQAQALSGSWSNFGTMAGLAAQYTGNSSGLAAQLGVVQQSYAGATDTSGRVAALQQIISLEQGIWNAQQESRQAEATAAQGRATAARSQLQSVNQLISAAKSLGDYASKLGYSEASGLTDSERFDALQSQYLQLLGKANAGDADAMGELQNVAGSYLGLAEQMSASQSAYSVLSGTIAAELASTAALQSASATSQAAQYERSIAAAETAAATASAQFTVSTATQKLIDELLQESAQGFASDASLTQQLIDQGAMTADALSSLPRELSGAIGATLIPVIGGIASAIQSISLAAGVDGSHYNGLANVPFDGYIAKLHKNERVLTAKENRAYSMPVMQRNSNAEPASNAALERKVELLERQMERVAAATERLADMTERVTADGNANAAEIVNVRELAQAIKEAMAV